MIQDTNHPVRDAFELYKAAARESDACLKSDGTVPKEVISRVFEGAHLVLRAYCRPSNWPSFDAPQEHLPIQLAHSIANQIQYIVAGKCPEPIAQLTGRGSPGVGPHESRDIGIAVAYIKAAKSGDIKDRAPVKRIAQLFGVTHGAVRKWQRNYAFAEANDFFPHVSSSERLTLIKNEMRKAALRYRSTGRGSQGRFGRPYL
jgi:hypothetical protein